MKKIILLIIILLIIVFGYIAYKIIGEIELIDSNSQSSLLPVINDNKSKPENIFYFPIDQFSERITKKPYGIYITPQNSPVQPEMFKGYHTGVDVEYQDKTEDVPILAVSNGVIKLARVASGYGGVIILAIEFGGAQHSVVYGHIRPSSLPVVGNTVKKGDTIGLLGTGFSAEIDGERRHLHFAVLSNNRLDLLGYVQDKSALAGWIDPESLFIK